MCLEQPTLIFQGQDRSDFCCLAHGWSRFLSTAGSEARRHRSTLGVLPIYTKNRRHKFNLSLTSPECKLLKRVEIQTSRWYNWWSWNPLCTWTVDTLQAPWWPLLDVNQLRIEWFPWANADFQVILISTHLSTMPFRPSNLWQTAFAFIHLHIHLTWAEHVLLRYLKYYVMMK